MKAKITRRKLPDDLMQQTTGGLTNRIERLDRRLEKLDLSFRRKKAEKDFEVRHDHRTSRIRLERIQKSIFYSRCFGLANVSLMRVTVV